MQPRRVRSLGVLRNSSVRTTRRERDEREFQGLGELGGIAAVGTQSVSVKSASPAGRSPRRRRTYLGATASELRGRARGRRADATAASRSVTDGASSARRLVVVSRRISSQTLST